MSTQIQEPGQVASGELNPSTENNFEILCYQRSQDFAGIKRLGLVDWKSYLGFNSHKVDNLAKLTGFTIDEYGPDYDIPNPDYTLKEQVLSIAQQAGVNSEPTTIPPEQTLNARITTLEESVDGYEEGGEHVDGLIDKTTDLLSRMSTVEDEISGTGGTPTADDLLTRMSTAETDVGNLDGRVTDLENEVGGGGGGGDNLFTRMGNAETNITALQHSVDGYEESGVTHKGLLQRATEIETLLGTPTSGSSLSQTNVCARLEYIDDQINGSGNIATTVSQTANTVSELSGLMTQANQNIASLQTVVGNNTVGSESGLCLDVKTLQTTVGDNSNGLVKEVNDLKQNMTTVYNVKGNLDQTTASGWTNADFEAFGTGDVWNIVGSGAGNSVTINVPKTSSTTEAQTFYNGANILWIKDTTNYVYGYFDELGTAIDVSELNRLSTVVGSDTAPKSGLCLDVDNLKATVDDSTTGVAALNTKVDVLESKYQTDTNAANHWVSGDGNTQGLSGRYIITADCNNPSSTAIFYMKFSANGICITTDTKCIDGSNANYSTYFTVDLSDGFIKAKATTPYVSVAKIGD